jgi:hypothetical protein
MASKMTSGSSRDGSCAARTARTKRRENAISRRSASRPPLLVPLPSPPPLVLASAPPAVAAGAPPLVPPGAPPLPLGSYLPAERGLACRWACPHCLEEGQRSCATRAALGCHYHASPPPRRSLLQRLLQVALEEQLLPRAPVARRVAVAPARARAPTPVVLIRDDLCRGAGGGAGGCWGEWAQARGGGRVGCCGTRTTVALQRAAGPPPPAHRAGELEGQVERQPVDYTLAERRRQCAEGGARREAAADGADAQVLLEEGRGSAWERGACSGGARGRWWRAGGAQLRRAATAALFRRRIASTRRRRAPALPRPSNGAFRALPRPSRAHLERRQEDRGCRSHREARCSCFKVLGPG